MIKHNNRPFLLVVREHLKVRQVLAKPRPSEDSFTAMIAGMGKPKAVSTTRKKNLTGIGKRIPKQSGRSGGRFSVDTTSCSDGEKAETPTKTAPGM